MELANRLITSESCPAHCFAIPLKTQLERLRSKRRSGFLRATEESEFFVIGQNGRDVVGKRGFHAEVERVPVRPVI